MISAEVGRSFRRFPHHFPVLRETLAPLVSHTLHPPLTPAHPATLRSAPSHAPLTPRGASPTLVTHSIFSLGSRRFAHTALPSASPGTGPGPCHSLSSFTPFHVPSVLSPLVNRDRKEPHPHPTPCPSGPLHSPHAPRFPCLLVTFVAVKRPRLGHRHPLSAVSLGAPHGLRPGRRPRRVSPLDSPPYHPPRSSLRSCHSPLVVGAVRYAEPGSRRPPHHTPVGRRIGGPAGLRRMGVR